MLLTPARFRLMETQYDEVIDYWDDLPFRMLSTAPIITEVSSTEPANAEGRIYFNSSSSENTFYISDSATWIDLMEGL